MRKARGYTFVEIWAAVAIMGIVAAIAVVIFRHARANASFDGATFEVAERLRGLRSRAMNENADYVFVLADSSSADALNCSWTNRADCAQWWILKIDPAVPWSLANFVPASPVNANATLDDNKDTYIMPRGVHLAMPPPAFTPPAPFGGVAVNDPALTPSINGRFCFAIRFTATGRVVSDPPNAGAGYAFALTPTSNWQVDMNVANVVLVSFPTGIVKTYSYLRR